jgi:type I thyroxine 5'-deiodinase
VVYITEAHSSDMWQMQSNVHDGVIFANPTTAAAREEVAGACVRNLHISIPALIDSLDNTVEKNYTAWPDRLFVIGKDGVIRWKSEAGPFGFSATGLEAALQSLPGDAVATLVDPGQPTALQH